jgi:excisionase family DNA binding protein
MANQNPEAAASTIQPRGYKPNTVADLLDVSRGTVFSMLRKGELESVKIGRSRIITARSIEKLLHGEAA